MLFEIRLYVSQEMRGRVPTKHTIIAVTENGVEREPKSTDFIVALDYIMNNTDLTPVKSERVSGKRSDVRQTWCYVYAKPGTYIQKRYNKWAVAYQKEGSEFWWVHKINQDTDTCFRTKSQAMADVDTHVGYDYVHELRKDGMVGSGVQSRATRYLMGESERSGSRPSGERLQKQAEQDSEDLFG